MENFELPQHHLEFIKYLHSLPEEEYDKFWRLIGVDAEKENLQERLTNLLNEGSPISKKLIETLQDFLSSKS
jgi:hypothetical protein